MPILGRIEDIRGGKMDTAKRQSARVQKAEETQKRTMSGGLIEGLVYGLPGRVKAEKAIEARMQEKSPLTEFKESLKDLNKYEGAGETAVDAFKTLLSGSEFALDKTLGVGAAALYELQDWYKNPLTTGKDVASSMFNQLTGKRTVKFSDVVQSRLPEMNVGGYDISGPISGIVGMAGEMYGAAKMWKGIDRAAQLFQKNEKVMGTIDKGLKLAKEVHTAAGENIKHVFRSIKGQKGINPNVLNRAMDLIDDKLLKNFYSNKVENVVEETINVVKKRVIGLGSSSKTIEKTKTVGTGRPLNTYENMWELRKSVDDQLSNAEFIKGASDKTKQALLKARNLINDELKKVSPEMGELMENYSNLSKSYGFVRSKLVDAHGIIDPSRVASILRNPWKLGEKNVLSEFSNMFPKGAEMMNRISALNKKIAYINTGKSILKTMVGASIIGSFMKGKDQILPEEISGDKT